MATRLLGVGAVIASGFERIHCSNLVGMGVLPCELPKRVTAKSLSLEGTERLSLAGLDDAIQPRQRLTLVVGRTNGSRQSIGVTLRLYTLAELGYAREGGLVPSMLASYRKAA